MAGPLRKAKGEYILENILISIVDSVDQFSLTDTEAMWPPCQAWACAENKHWAAFNPEISG